jgi:hypothetical protein
MKTPAARRCFPWGEGWVSDIPLLTNFSTDRIRARRVTSVKLAVEVKRGMRPLKRALTVIVAVFFSLCIGAWMLMGPAVIRVENHSAREIRSIEMAGNGFSERISRLKPGGSVCVRPSGIPGESGLEFRADSDAGRIEATDLTYIEASGGYHVRILVSPDLKVNASHDGSVWMAFCGIWR